MLGLYWCIKQYCKSASLLLLVYAFFVYQISDPLFKFTIFSSPSYIIKDTELNFVCIQDFWSAVLLEVISHCYMVFAVSYFCYLMLRVKILQQHLLFMLVSKSLAYSFANYDITNVANCCWLF